MSTKIEIRCTEAFKKSVKEHAKAKGTDMTTYIKKALFSQMQNDSTL